MKLTLFLGWVFGIMTAVLIELMTQCAVDTFATWVLRLVFFVVIAAAALFTAYLFFLEWLEGPRK